MMKNCTKNTLYRIKRVKVRKNHKTRKHSRVVREKESTQKVNDTFFGFSMQYTTKVSRELAKQKEKKPKSPSQTCITHMTHAE